MDYRQGAHVIFNVEIVVRIVAAVAALALVASPIVVAAWGKAKAWLTRPATPTGDATLEDMRVVLELANRLRLAGNTEGVALCQQLIDCMLKPRAK